MKELSIEEKARRYDEAYKKVAVRFGSNVADEIFLKESEDEKIRKWIIGVLEALGQNPRIHIGLSPEMMPLALAYLKKQGEQKPKFRVGDTIKCKYDDRQFTIKSVDLDKGTYTYTQEGYGNDIDYADEKFELVEQKPADKVELKFKVGDWVVNTITKEVEQVIELTDCEYICSGHLIISFNNQHLLKRWTIKDAKDGDVLAVEEIEEKYQYPFVAIYKERGLDFFNSYCSIGFDGKFYEADTGHSTKKIHPATKKQRDLLFQKMKEAGYEWDAKKKELKKIEQKPTEDVNLPEFESYLCLMLQKFRTEGMCTNGEIIDYVKEHSQKLRDILIKPAWSEEYNKIIEEIINDIECARAINYHAPKEGYEFRENWLKSLKNRVQPKQEWSEDDKYNHNIILYLLNNECVGAADKRIAIEWFKYLKERYTWKPSDEQMEALANALSLAKNCGEESAFDLRTLHEQLKKLKS